MTTSGMAGMSGGRVGGYTGAMPSLGARVVTADGDGLGTVKEVVDSCFKVDAAMRPDYWLGMDTIADCSGMDVRLALPKDRIGDVKLDGPEHGGVPRHRA